MCIGLLAAAVGGCSHQPALVGRESLTAVRLEALPEPGRSDITASAREYVIGPFDQISVEVFGLPEFSRAVQADASGRIAYPFVGEIEANGMTPGELSDRISTGLAQIVRAPQVSVNVTDTVSHVVTVDGQVKEPGLYPVLGNMSLMRAVASAKGLTEYARDEEIVLFRKANGQEYAALYDLAAIRLGIYPDPAVYPNDVIVVGDSPGKRMLRDLIQAGTILTAPLVAILQRN